MTPEKIIEIAHETVRLTWINDSPEDLIAFAQSVIEAERESSDKPVAWIDHEGGLYHYKLYETYLPLYRHPPHKRKSLTDEDIKTLWVENLITVSEEQGYIRFARAIERRINGE